MMHRKEEKFGAKQAVYASTLQRFHIYSELELELELEG